MNKLVFACLFLFAALVSSQITTTSVPVAVNEDWDIDVILGNEEGGEGELGEGEYTEGEIIEGGGAGNEEEWIGEWVSEEGFGFEEGAVDISEIIEEQVVELIPVDIEPVEVQN